MRSKKIKKSIILINAMIIKLANNKYFIEREKSYVGKK